MRIRVRVAAFAAFFAVLAMPAANLPHSDGCFNGGSHGCAPVQA